MAEARPRQTALAHRDAATLTSAGFRLREVAHTAKVALRGDPADETFRTAIADVLALALPTAPNRAVRGPTATALWLGPDEWLVVSGPGAEASLVQGLSEVLAGCHAAAVDVSDGRTVLRLTGPAARDVLARGCAMDLHPRAFAVDDVVQTVLAKADVILHQVADGPDGPSFDIYVARSYADYLWRWLGDCGATFH